MCEYSTIYIMENVKEAIESYILALRSDGQGIPAEKSLILR